MVHCPCDSTKLLTECCSPLHEGARTARTAEELLRSRYSAYVLGKVSYLMDTLHPDERNHHDEETIRRWSSESEWLGLEVLESSESEDGSLGTVEFVARYKNASGESVAHHERSHFERVDGLWFFRDGAPLEAGTVTRDTPKVGRNDLCPCGSGRKFKRCCAP